MSRLSGVCDVPRQIEDPVEVGADDRVLGRADLHVAQALELLLRDLLGLGRQVRLRDALLEAVEIALIAVVLAELFLDGLELLAEDVLALVLAHLLLDLGVDALAHLEDLELAREERSTLRMRSFTSTVSRSCAFSSTGASRFAATRSASAPGAWIESMSEPASRGSSGMSWMTCLAMSRRLIASASASSSSTRGSSRRLTFALRYGAVCGDVVERMRVRPWRMSE